MKIIKLLTDREFMEVIEIQKENLLDFTRVNNPDYAGEIEKKGFFIAPCSLDELKNDKEKILIGIEENNKILAYVWVSVMVDNHKYNNWKSEEIEKNIFDKKIYKIKEIAVKKTELGKGWGGILLKALEEYLDNKSIKYLVSSVAFYPIKNLASIGFHEKNGFEVVSISPKVEYFGFKKYQCVLMAKKINPSPRKAGRISF